MPYQNMRDVEINYYAIDCGNSDNPKPCFNKELCILIRSLKNKIVKVWVLKPLMDENNNFSNDDQMKRLREQEKHKCFPTTFKQTFNYSR
jgi:hypothetical protein